jgi:uncharacterized membrane protein
MTHAIKLSTLLLSGLIAGTFFYGTFCVLPAFYEVPSEIHLTFRTSLMKHNKVLVMLLVLLQLGFNTAYLFNIRTLKIARTLCLIALVLTIGSLLITRFGSVPLNLTMKTWNPQALPSDANTLLEKWDFYNAIRTFNSLASFLLVLIASEIQNSRTSV